MSTRPQNERKFGHWEELPYGGRRYWFEVAGRRGWKARYVTEVNADENTIRFWQEIYDNQNTGLDHGVGHPSASVGSKSTEAAEKKTCEHSDVSLSGQSGRRADRSQNTLVEIHEKYPVDKGHRPVQEG